MIIVPAEHSRQTQTRLGKYRYASCKFFMAGMQSQQDHLPAEVVSHGCSEGHTCRHSLTFTSRSQPADTMMGFCVTGEKRTHATHSVWPSGSPMVYLHSPIVFHSLIVLSRAPDTICAHHPKHSGPCCSNMKIA